MNPPHAGEAREDIRPAGPGYASNRAAASHRSRSPAAACHTRQRDPMTRDTSVNPQVSAITLGVRDTGRARMARFVLPAIMATVMSFVMSLVETVARLGFAPDLVWSWLTSFAIGVVVAAPTAVLVAPLAQRLVGHLTGAPPR